MKRDISQRSSQDGFAHVGLILLLVVVLGVAGGGSYYVWHKNHEKKDSNSQSNTQASKITSYAECLKAKDSIIQDSYPATCVTKDKERFTQPIEQKYLTIKEWGVKILLPQSLGDMTYHLISNDKYLPPSAFLSTKKLDASTACQKYYSAGAASELMPSYQWIERYTPTAKVSFDEGQSTLTADQAAAQRPDTYKKVGDHIYHRGKGNGMPCSEQTSEQSDAFNSVFDTLSAE